MQHMSSTWRTGSERSRLSARLRRISTLNRKLTASNKWKSTTLTACAPCRDRFCRLVAEGVDPPCHDTIGPEAVLAWVDAEMAR